MSIEASPIPVSVEKPKQSIDVLTSTQRLTAGLVEASEVLPRFRAEAKRQAIELGLRGADRRSYIRQTTGELLLNSADLSSAQDPRVTSIIAADELIEKRAELQEMVASWANATEVSEFATAQRKTRRGLPEEILHEYLRKREIPEDLVENLPLARKQLRKKSLLSGGITVASTVAAYVAGKQSVNALPNETLTALGAVISYAGYLGITFWKGIENNRLLDELHVGLNALSKFCYDHTRHSTLRMRLPGFGSKEVNAKKVAAGAGYGAWQVISEVPVGVGMYEASQHNGITGLGEYATGANLASIGWFGGEIAASWYARKRGKEVTVEGLLTPKQKKEKTALDWSVSLPPPPIIKSSNHM